MLLRENNNNLEEMSKEEKRIRKELRLSLDEKTLDYSILGEDYQKLLIKLKFIEGENTKLEKINE